MANEYLNIVDLAQRTGIDFAIETIDAASKVAPEVRAIRGRPINGTSYNLDVLTERGRGGFRHGNEGVNTTKNKYGKQNVECFIFDAQMEADKMLADAHPYGRESFLAQESLEIARGNFESLGSQVYAGTNAGPKGFKGFEQYTQSHPSLRLNAEGNSSGNMTSVYAVYSEMDGVHFVFGANGDIDVQPEWTEGYSWREGKKLKVYQNGITFWIGLQIAPLSLVRIANVSATKPANDQVIADALRKLPRSRMPNMLLMNRDAAFWLQKSRSATTITNSGGKTSTGEGNWAPQPTESNNIPIIVTDSITTTEETVSFA